MDELEFNTDDLTNGPGADVVRDAITRTFELSPSTVYGLLAGILLILVIYLLLTKDRLNKRMTDKLMSIQKENLETLKDLGQGLLLLRESVGQGADAVTDFVDISHKNITAKIQNLENRLFNEK